MSKTIRFKLNATEEKYVLSTLNMIRDSGVRTGSLADFAKASILEFCVGINGRIRTEMDRIRESTANGVDNTGESDGATGSEGSEATGSSEEEGQEATSVEEAEGSELASGNGGE